MPPIDAQAEAVRRRDILTASAAGQKVNESPATLSRWRRAYAAEGVKGLEPSWSKCGRKPLAVLDEVEEMTAKQLLVKTGSASTALRKLAAMPLCSQATADAILKIRASKHTITKTIRRQIELPQAVLSFHKSPKRVRTHFFINPRTLSYLDPLGQERELRVGDLSERDDMSNNFLVWVPWPQGGDPCSDRFGVRIARGQLLCQIDVRSLYFQSFCFLIRLRDSYRADDIWQWVGRTYRDLFVPAIGERWERGIWSSNKLRGYPIEAGHTDDATRLGGIQALGRTVIESHSPTTKIIENRFNFFQTACADIDGQIGRSRGEMERENKLWTECREGRRDPRNHFLSYDAACGQIEARMQWVNHEPMEGALYRGVPADIYSRGLAERGDELQKLGPEQTYLFSRNLRFTTCNKAHALLRPQKDGNRGALWFHAEQLYRHEGEKLAVYFDRDAPQEGAVVVPIRPGRKVEPIACELVDGCPQFAQGLDLECGPAAQAMLDARARREGFENAVISEYRAIGLAGKRAPRTRSIDNGAGRRADIETRNSPHMDQPARGGQAEDEEKPPGRTGSSRRTTQPTLSDDADYMRRLEEKFAEAHPGLGST